MAIAARPTGEDFVLARLNAKSGGLSKRELVARAIGVAPDDECKVVSPSR